MTNVEKFSPVAKSIRETGAVAGDLVRCVSSNDPRFVKGEFFTVFLHFGRPHILSGNWIKPTDAEQRRGIQLYQIPVEGFGATWQRVDDEA